MTGVSETSTLRDGRASATAEEVEEAERHRYDEEVTQAQRAALDAHWPPPEP